MKISRRRRGISPSISPFLSAITGKGSGTNIGKDVQTAGAHARKKEGKMTFVLSLNSLSFNFYLWSPVAKPDFSM